MNKVIRRQIHYLDTIAATPFRVIKQSVPESDSTKYMHEAFSAVEGLARAPFKFALATFEDDGYGGFKVDEDGKNNNKTNDEKN